LSLPSPYPPPLSPVLFAGLLLRTVPTVLLRPLADAAMAVMVRRHRDLFASLAPLSGTTFLIEPTDIPLRFVLHLSTGGVTLTPLSRAGAVPPTTVTVRAPFTVLIELLEGRRDADALFFTRDLAIEGDTEAALFLRNAIEAADIDVETDLTAGFGPFAPIVRAAWRRVRSHLESLARDLVLLRDAALAPVHERCDRLAGEIRQIESDATSRPRPRASASLSSSSAGSRGVP
jgi:predicted lipid carrier protein YhbT